MDPTKIARMATACLEEVETAKSPFRQVEQFLRRLHANPEWTDEEVIEVQTLVIRELMRQMSENGASG
jgi:hypothetical protein